MLEQVPACIHPLLHPLTQLCFVNLSVSLSDHKQGREKWLPDLHWLFLLALTFSFLLLEKCWIVSSQLVLSVWWNCLWKTQSVAFSLPLHKAFVIRMEWPSPAIWCQVFFPNPITINWGVLVKVHHSQKSKNNASLLMTNPRCMPKQMLFWIPCPLSVFLHICWSLHHQHASGLLDGESSFSVVSIDSWH